MKQRKQSPLVIIEQPEDFARVASPSFTENVTYAGRQARTHAETRKRFDIYKSASVACAGALHVHDRLFVTQAGRDAETRKRFDIYKSV